MAQGASDRDQPDPGDRGDGTPVDEPPAAPSWRNALPFLVALGVVVVAAVGIGISYLVRPADDRMSTEAHVQHAINNAYTARNDLDYAKFRDATCAADLSSTTFPSESTFLGDNRRSFDENGHIVIPEISGVTVDGDRATAQVHWHFDEKSDQNQVTEMVVVREDGDWKVCTS
ncbi:Rv0361 family membrane protein [Gordonia insulae]|nr:hypothetical protein [Gordonia insulae]